MHADPTPRPREEGPAASPGAAHLLLEGAFHTLSSTALVNRALGAALRARGRIGFSPLPLDAPAPGAAPSAPPPGVPDRALVHAWHQWPPRSTRPPRGRWVVFQGWEYGSLPAELAALFRDGPDEVWTYSTHCAHAFLEDGVPPEKVRVVPLGVDPRRYAPAKAPSERRPPRPLPGAETVFLFVGGTLFRKGVDLLLSAYAKAFTPSDDVLLVLKDMGSDSFYKGYNLSEAAARLAAHPRAPRIVLLKDRLEEEEMAALYRSADCLVHPYRGEGFGLPVLEALACGLPVIVTRGGACDDFLPREGEGLFPLPARRRPVELPYETARPPWLLEPDPDALVEALRAVARDPGAARAAGLAGSRRVRSRWTWDRTAACVEDRCRRLAEGGPGERISVFPFSSPFQCF